MIEPTESTLEMTRSGVRLHQPLHQEEGEQLVYGLAFPMQVSPTEVALLANIRNTGVPVVDFENGWDIVVFDDLSQIRADRAVKGARNEPAVHPDTGQQLTMVHIVPTGGFVPLGAKLADGRPHPHQGTGFGVSAVRGFPADNSEPNAHVGKNMHQYRQLIQFRYDGHNFEVTHIDKVASGEFLDGWRMGGGLSAAIADGEDLLFGVAAGRAKDAGASGDGNSDGRYGCGLSRWRYGADGWRPVKFVPVTDADQSFEPSLIRERDGSLLFSVRGNRVDNAAQTTEQKEDTYHHFRVYRSFDNGANWNRVIHLPDIRAASPVSLIQTAGGQVFLAANPRPQENTDSKGRFIPTYSQRNRLWFWPLAPDRQDTCAPYHAFNLDEVLGPPRDLEARGHDNRWYADHVIGGPFRLGDEEWHSLVSFRVSDAAVNMSGSSAAPEAGLWVEQMIEPEPSEDLAIVPWQF